MMTTNVTRIFRSAIPMVISLAITTLTVVKTSIFYGAGMFTYALNPKIFRLILGNFWEGGYAVWTEPYITVGCLFLLSILAWATTIVILNYERRKSTTA